MTLQCKGLTEFVLIIAVTIAPTTRTNQLKTKTKSTIFKMACCKILHKEVFGN